VKNAANTPYGEFGRENALDYYESTINIMPGANETYRYKFIWDSLGLLQTNKQIHHEANTTLFSKNIFLIMPEWERVHTFWRCDNNLCRTDVPCFIHLRNFKQIKHLNININNRRALDDPKLKVESLNLEQNIKTMVRCILTAGIKLHTLKIRYTSCFDGQIDAVRGNLEGKLPEGMPERTTMIKDSHGNYHNVKKSEAHQYLFRHGNMLNSLRCLKGIADDVKIRGDLPQALMDELAVLHTSPHVAPALKKKQAAEQAARKDRQEKEKGTGFHAFMQEMLKKHEGKDPGMADFCRQALKTSVKSPAVLADLMMPPTLAEMDRIGRQPFDMPSDHILAEDGGDAQSGESDDDEDEMDDNHGGIGIINGKPVFGPVRPTTDY
jgi:hypothetical protein